MYVIKDLTFKTFEALVSWFETEYGVELIVKEHVSEDDKLDTVREIERMIDCLEFHKKHIDSYESLFEPSTEDDMMALMTWQAKVIR